MLNKKIKIMISALAVTTMITSTVVMGVAKADTNTTDIATSTIGTDTVTVGTSSATTSIATGTVATSTESVGTGTIAIDNDYDIDLTGTTIEDMDKKMTAEYVHNDGWGRNYSLKTRYYNNLIKYLKAKTNNGIEIVICGSGCAGPAQVDWIPEEIDGYKVTSIVYDGGGFGGRKVILPETINYIGNHSFDSWEIRELDISKNVKYIDKSLEFPCYLNKITIYKDTIISSDNNLLNSFPNITIYTEEGSDIQQKAISKGLNVVLLNSTASSTIEIGTGTVTDINNTTTSNVASATTSTNTEATDTVKVGTSTITDTTTASVGTSTTTTGNTVKTGDVSSLPIVLSSILGLVGVGIFKKRK